MRGGRSRRTINQNRFEESKLIQLGLLRQFTSSEQLQIKY